jgi:hypothetical protein
VKRFPERQQASIFFSGNHPDQHIATGRPSARLIAQAYNRGAMEPPRRHQCMIYSGDSSRQFPSLAATIKAKLRINYRCLFIGSPGMLEGLGCCLAATGVVVASEVSRGRLVLSSKREFSNKTFHPDVMVASLVETLEQTLRDGYAGLWASGDVSWEIGSPQEASKLPEYERCIERLFSDHPQLSGICQYHADRLLPEALHQALRVHPTIFINDVLTLINPHYVADSSQPATADDSTVLDSMIRKLVQPVILQESLLYRLSTSVGEFQIYMAEDTYFPAFDGKRIGKNTYVHPQFVIDDLVTGIIDVAGTLSSVTSGLPEDLSGWKRNDTN